MKKILDSITLELTVLLLVFALLLQNQLLYMNIDSTTFVLLNILTFLAIFFGLLSSSVVIVASKLIIFAIGVFTMYFNPIIIANWLKVYLIILFPVFSAISYLVQKRIFRRLDLVYNQKDIGRYLENRNSITGLKNKTAFENDYGYILEFDKRRSFDNRGMYLSLFYVDFIEQYLYQDVKATETLLRQLKEALVTNRFPEERIYYIETGAFLILSPRKLTPVTEEDKVVLNENTREILQSIPFITGQNEVNITLKYGTLTIDATSVLTAEQTISRLKRLAETDLSAEYFV